MRRFLIVALTLCISTVGFAQDPTKVAAKQYTVVADTPGFRVLRINYEARAETQAHQHPEAMVVSLVASRVRFDLPDGKSETMDMAANSARFTPAGTHSVRNLGGPVDAVLIEFKAAKPGTAALPASREGLALKPLVEGPRASAYLATGAGTFAEPAGSKHDFDQVVIATGPAQMSLSVDGKPAKTSWARGDTVIIPRGTGHESKNTGGKPVDFIVVAIK
jgi:mannose-6-phosphate isomerase-like protein (cupin superfamily)